MKKIGIIGCSKMVKILDTTLREGEQTPGVHFKLEQKVEIAELLDKFGVDYIEAGMPIISEHDKRCVKAIASLGLKAEILGHAKAKKEDIDAVVETGCQWVGIFCGINDLSLKYKLDGKNKQEVYKMIEESIKYAKSKGLKVRYTVEDATRTLIENLIEVARLAKNAGADRYSIADTVGCSTPEKMLKLVSTIRKKVNIELEAHCHNDLGLANANSLAAFRAGAAVIDVTINGIGERTGLTSLQEFSLALKTLYRENTRKYNLLPELSKLVEKYSGFHLDSLRPIVGDNAFTHTARLHKEAVKKETSCYEFINPEIIGRSRNLEVKDNVSYARLIGNPFIKSSTELTGHQEGQGIRYVFLDKRVIPDSTIYSIVRKVVDVHEDSKSHVDMHKHNCDSAFLFIGNRKNLRGLVCEVSLGNEKYLIESPTSVFIPKGLNHSYRLVRGSGYYINIVLSSDYNCSIK